MDTPNKGPVVRVYDNMVLLSLTPERHAQTCGYWYAVLNNTMAHIAFKTKAELITWLHRYNLKTKNEIPDEGEPAVLTIIGKYNEAMHISEELFAWIKGEDSKIMSNGRLTKATISYDLNGIATVHYLNPNCNRVEY